jgi:hypothetical protein
MGRPTTRRIIGIVGSAMAVLVIVLIWTLTRPSPSGDPGARVMNQLTPTVSALPGYGTSVSWVRHMPQCCGASYAVKIEPFQDSCDGMAGTQGWSSVVVQAGFRWSKSISALVAFMEPRLSKLGWSPRKRSPLSTNQYWFKRLSDGAMASVGVEREGSPNAPVWQLDAISKPIGRAASGC